MYHRFSIFNLIQPVSLEQFAESANALNSAIKEVKPNVETELLLTTNIYDYLSHRSLTIPTPQKIAANKRREKFKLEDLNEELWRKSFERELYIRSPSENNNYMICLSQGIREPKQLFFYGQCLDEKSQEVFDSFAKTRFFQRLGDGFQKTTKYQLVHALSGSKI